MATLAEIRREVAKEHRGYWAGTPTGGSTTSLIDTSNDSPFYTDDNAVRFKGKFVYFLGGLNAGITKRVAIYTPASQELTWTGALGSTAAAGDYEIYQFHPVEDYKRWINLALSRIYHDQREIITLLQDGSMEATTTTAFNTGGGAGIVKNTSVVMFGTRSALVTASANGGYVSFPTLPVVPGEQFSLAAPIRVVTGEARLIAYDVANGAQILSLNTNVKNWRVAFRNLVIPAGCTELSIRLGLELAGDSAYFDSVQLLNTESRRIALPSWVTGPGIVSTIEKLSLTSAENSDLYRVDRSIFREVPDFNVDYIPTDASPATLEFRQPWHAALTFIRGYKAHDQLSADSDNTTADTEHIKYAALAQYCEDMLSGVTSADDTKRLEREQKRFALLAQGYNMYNAARVVHNIRIGKVR